MDKPKCVQRDKYDLCIDSMTLPIIVIAMFRKLLTNCRDTCNIFIYLFNILTFSYRMTLGELVGAGGGGGAAC